MSEENKIIDLQNQLIELKAEYKKLSKELKPKLKNPIINKLLNRPSIAVTPSKGKVDRLNNIVVMISKLETEILLLQHK